MDPNATLANIRSITDTHNVEGLSDPLASFDELVELVEALDGWLTGGGFLPSEWQS